MTIKIEQLQAFRNVLTMVIDEQEDRTRILDVRAGDLSDHSEATAKYHATKANQGMVPISMIDGTKRILTVGDDNEM